MGDRYSKKEMRELRARWKDQQPRIKAIIHDIHLGNDWTRNLLESKEKGWEELPFISTCPSKFKIPYEVAIRDIRGLELENIDLSGTDSLADSCMDLCVFKKVILDSASLNGASLCYSKFDEECVLDRTNLQSADLRYSNFPGVSFVDANLTGADLRGANFINTILFGVKLNYIKYSEEGFLSFLIPRKWRKEKWTLFGGEFQSPNLLDSEISYPVAKFLEGENIRWIFDRKYPKLGFLFYVLANYGRSLRRLLFWVFSIWLFFGIIYAGYSLPPFLEDTIFGDILCWFAPKIDWKEISPTECFFRPFYFSMVTMTTLGFGDITPSPMDWKAQLYVCIQAFGGYLILGLFIGALIQNASNPFGSIFRSDKSYKKRK